MESAPPHPFGVTDIEPARILRIAEDEAFAVGRHPEGKLAGNHEIRLRIPLADANRLPQRRTGGGIELEPEGRDRMALPASPDEFQPRFLDQESQVRAPPPLPWGVG
jgi:hypothetical protein